ncbi:hypothetical protein [Halomonas colorata]|uniref:hypothetical protein n=1 Tax=Halomonas colorata TaxID=2742615 RepID=UPI0018671317|nr:hypothetical protein [Halomonas colorata]
MIEHYLDCRHEFGGRGPTAFDCWGQVRDVRANVFGWEWLPSYGAIADGDKRAFTDACVKERVAFQEVAATPGAIATVWRHRLCVHVGIVVLVDGILAVLETNPGSGPRWLSVADFERQYLKVIYYHDR